MAKGQLLGIPNWIKKKLNELENKVKINEELISQVDGWEKITCTCSNGTIMQQDCYKNEKLKLAFIALQINNSTTGTSTITMPVTCDNSNTATTAGIPISCDVYINDNVAWGSARLINNTIQISTAFNVARVGGMFKIQ